MRKVGCGLGVIEARDDAGFLERIGLLWITGA